MIRVTTFSILGTILVLLMVNFFHNEEPLNKAQYELKQKYIFKPSAKVDHSQFESLHKDFKTPQEVTETCIECHNERHIEVMHSNHWNWDRLEYVEGKGIDKLGKKNVLNNFCIGASGNEQSCAKCHIGYGMNGDTFDFSNARNVDCMVCHDKSEAYIKGASMAGYPDRSVNLTEVAQHVGRPDKINDMCRLPHCQ